MNKLTYLIGFALLSVGITSCNQNTQDKGAGAEPGPVTEVDKQRYNLNSTDVRLYDSPDSTRIDSVNKDTSDRSRD